MPKKGLASEFRRRREQAGIQSLDEKLVATITLHKVAEMNDDGRLAVAEWLRKQAFFLQTDGAKFSKSYRARYLAR